MSHEEYPSQEYRYALEEFVDREVHDNVSKLVAEGAKDDPTYKNMFTRFNPERARRLVEAAIEKNGAKQRMQEELDLSNKSDLRTAMELLSIPLAAAEEEVREHWLVSEWLAAELKKKGENIEWDFYGLTVWGRCCSGQAISMDGVINAVFDEFYEG